MDKPHYHIPYKGQLLAGTDEVGRGPLAGPVIAAAVILSPKYQIVGLTDSKKLTDAKRRKLVEIIQQQSLCYAYGRAEVDEIDNINILQASLLAMQRAIQGLSIKPEYVVVDGNFCPPGITPCQAIVQGDLYEPTISAASILAKVARDDEMILLDEKFPNYGFSQHKGYATKDHLVALRTHGISTLHRRSFAPVKNLIVELGM